MFTKPEIEAAMQLIQLSGDSNIDFQIHDTSNSLCEALTITNTERMKKEVVCDDDESQGSCTTSDMTSLTKSVRRYFLDEDEVVGRKRKRKRFRSIVEIYSRMMSAYMSGRNTIRTGAHIRLMLRDCGKRVCHMVDLWMASLLINAQNVICISTKSIKQISVTIKVEVNGELFDVNVLEIGTWNTNITDTASDVSSQIEANHLDKDDTSIEDKENDDLDDIDGILKDLDNDAKNKENVFVSPKEVVHDQPIKQVEEDILKQPEEECIKVSESSDLSHPPGFENTKNTLSNNSKCSTNFARHNKKDIKGISFIHELNKIIEVGTTLGYDVRGCKKSLNRMINGIAGTKLSKLDRFLISEGVMEDIPDIKVTAIERLWSDHSLILLHSKKVDLGANSSFFTLISNISNPLSVKDFCPISLIGTHYKIISKLLSNRFSKVIDKVVSKEQSTFISGCQILDGPLIISEIIQRYKKRKKKMSIFKVDFEKDFNSVSWKYLDFILDSLGFGSKWRSWIRACLHSSRASILINGSPTSEFSIKRGLRQGDPLSPFLFILVMEGLHCAMSNAVNSGLIRGIKLGSSGCAAGCFPFTYLGLPIGANMNLTSSWQILTDCFQKRLSLWKANLLSIGGRLTLIKAVLGSLGIYYLSIFKAPETILNSMKSLCSRFFWAGYQDYRNMVWVKWVAALTVPGLGLLVLHTFCTRKLSFLLTRFVSRWDAALVSDIGTRNTAYLNDLLLEISQIDISVDEDTCTCHVHSGEIKDVKMR
uniref:RNA-directed DNA polymerase, eukaryota n=1 Tax=Tanacetum cinerariifolium TaxID=118510 RepID=A0A6L2K2T6_TANCI|nr:RNA-directed DNA polymerase, eukaryota [Tanacetum cinerariifolium]